jgi:hypothetical protein
LLFPALLLTVAGVSLGGCALAGGGSPTQPKLMSVDVEAMPEPDPRAPQIEFMEVKATRAEREMTPRYSIQLRGTLARPDGLGGAYGPTAWTATQVLDAQGQPMQYQTDGYGAPDALLHEPVAELYRRLGVSLGRHTAARIPFAIQLRDLEYLTPKLSRLALRAYVLEADGERDLDAALPALDQSVTVAESWTLSIQPTADGKQEVLLHAIDPAPPVWPLQVDLVDASGQLLSAGFRRGIETLGNTLATRWKFNQDQLLGDDGRRLRLRIADDLHVKQVDTELGDVALIELKSRRE